jgi:hypothetical protein
VLDKSDAVEDYETQQLAEDPIAFTASTSDLDTLHYNAAMNADDSAEFKKAMLEEVNAHIRRMVIGRYGKKPRCLQIKPSFRLSGHSMKATNWYAPSIQIQGPFEHSWRHANAWSQLLGDLLSHSQLVLDSAVPHLGFTVLVINASN